MHPRPRCPLRLAAVAWAMAVAAAGFGQPPADEPQPEQPPTGVTSEDKGKEPAAEPWYSVHGQGTVVSQGNWKFRSPYEGPNSFLPILNYRTTETATLFLDGRLWRGADVVFNPEIAGGTGLSRTLGLA